MPRMVPSDGRSATTEILRIFLQFRTKSRAIAPHESSVLGPVAAGPFSLLRRQCRAPVASPLVIQNLAEIAHINPAPTRRALNEVLSLVLRLAAESFSDDRLGTFHRRFCRSNVVCVLRASTSARSAACSGVSPEMKALRHEIG